MGTQRNGAIQNKMDGNSSHTLIIPADEIDFTKETGASCRRRSSSLPGVRVSGTHRRYKEDRANSEREIASNAPGQQMVHQQVSLCPQ